MPTGRMSKGAQKRRVALPLPLTYSRAHSEREGFTMASAHPGSERLLGAAAVERARAIAPLVAAASSEIFEAGRLAARVLDAMYEADLFRVALPAHLGGGECDPLSFNTIAEVLGAADMSTAWCFVQAAATAHSLGPRLPPDVARMVFAGPTDVIGSGSPTKGPVKADLVEGGYRVSGEWAFASGCLHSTWFDARAVLYRDGEKVATPHGLGAFSSLLVPKSKVDLVDTWDVVGMRGTGSQTYRVRDALVPESWALPLAGPPPDSTGPAYRVPNLSLAHSAFASLALGGAGAALEDFGALATSKTAFLTSVPLHAVAGVQGVLGRGHARVQSALAYRDRSLQRIWAEAVDGVVTDAARAEVRLAATLGVEIALDVIDSVYRFAGTSGVFGDSPLQRRFQDIHVLSQQVFGRPAHYENVGRLLLGLEYERHLV